MKYIFLSVVLLLITIEGCHDNLEVIYSADKQSNSYKSFFINNKCTTTITLNGNRSKIQEIYSDCVSSRGLKQTNKDIKDLLSYYKLGEILKKSNIIKLVFFKNSTTFPFFINYFNNLSNKSADIFKYDDRQNLKKISRNYLHRLAKIIKESNLYNDAVKEMNYKTCDLSLDFSYWDKDKGLQTIPKVIDQFIIKMDNVIKSEKINFKKYPFIKYLPIRIRCHQLSRSLVSESNNSTIYDNDILSKNQNTLK